MSVPQVTFAAPIDMPLSPETVGPAADYSRQSNLALSFLCLPEEKRRDMNVFYTFCRVIDDIADADDTPRDKKQAQLDAWKRALSGNGGGERHLIGQMHGLIAKYRLQTELLLEIIAGCEMDLAVRTYETFADLRAYCYRVASAVGLVSIEIFGYQPQHAEACRQYAIDLGLALQLTNILRDVARDLDNDGRIYLPLEDLERFGLCPDDLRRRPRRDARLTALLRFHDERAEAFYRGATQSLPPDERRPMIAAEIMRSVYHRLLQMMRRDGYRVFEKQYRLTKPAKLWTLATVSMRTLLLS